MNPLLFVCVTNIFISLKIWSVPYVLHHEIEMDETYVTHCRKGRFIKDHPGKKRGTCTSRPVCPMRKCAYSLQFNVWENVLHGHSNVAKPSIKNVEDFCQSVANKSYVWTDGLQSYTKVLCEKKCTNKVLNTYSKYNAVNHLNNVNSFHSMIKEQYRFYRGVSSNTSTDIMLCLHYRRNIREWTHKNSCY